MARVVVQKCVCDSTYQNKKYGEDMRLMNVKGDKPDSTQCRCTICGKEHTIRK